MLRGEFPIPKIGALFTVKSYNIKLRLSHFNLRLYG